MKLLVQQHIHPVNHKEKHDGKQIVVTDYPAGLLASLSECGGVVTAESQLASAAAGACKKYQIP